MVFGFPVRARGEKVDAGFSQIARVFKESGAYCDSIESQQAPGVLPTSRRRRGGLIAAK
jgi:hypothetical protein